MAGHARVSRSAAQQSARMPDEELTLAEERGAARARAEMRDRLRDVLDEGRRVVRLGEHQIEVVETAALDALLESPPDDSR
jgi:hypothetical protein